MVLCLSAAAVACGSSDGGSAQAAGGAGGNAGHAGSAASGASNASAGSGGASAGTGGASVSGGGVGGGGSGGTGGTAGSGAAGSGGSIQVPAFVSAPTQTLVTHASTGGDGLVLLSSQVRQKIGSSLNYVDWFGELLNNSQGTRCFIKLDADFQNSSGVSVEKLTTYVSTAPYKVTGTSLSATCLAPGEKGIVWGNDLPSPAIDLAAISTLDVTLSSLEVDTAVPHPLAPKVGTLQKTYDSLGMDWTVSGSATAASSPIYNIDVTFWAKSGAFYVDNQDVFHLDDFLPGSVWSFDTSPGGLAAMPLDELTYTDEFIEGTTPAAKVAGGNAPTSPLAEAASLAQGVQQQAAARRARWLGP
ncbi:MAG TPA: hypothetical protein VNW92_27670 [Polyangiaceae bacterium]|nr:hypothetical protein [Polyangiaceae bacterium]